MMTRITENTIEEFAIELLEQLGYQYIYAPDIAHDGESPERMSYLVVLFTERLQDAIRRIKPKVLYNTQGKVNPIENNVIENINQICTLEKIRDTLLPKLMNGVVTVEL